jgi:hypothetical protein
MVRANVAFIGVLLRVLACDLNAAGMVDGAEQRFAAPKASVVSQELDAKLSEIRGGLRRVSNN